jgi:hypothetical protein
MNVRNGGRPPETRSHPVSTPRSDYEPVGETVAIDIGIGITNGSASESGAPVSTASRGSRLGSEVAGRRLARERPTGPGALEGWERDPPECEPVSQALV